MAYVKEEVWLIELADDPEPWDSAELDDWTRRERHYKLRRLRDGREESILVPCRSVTITQVPPNGEATA